MILHLKKPSFQLLLRAKSFHFNKIGSRRNTATSNAFEIHQQCPPRIQMNRLGFRSSPILLQFQHIVAQLNRLDNVHT